MIIDALVGWFGHSLPIFALLFIGIVVEKHYVSRVTVFTNVLALNMYFLTLTEAPRLMVWYADFGLILGMYGVIAYLINSRTHPLFAPLAFFLYSSFPVAAVILASPGNFIPVLILTSLLNFGAAYVLNDLFDWRFVHEGPRHGVVSRFIETERLEFIDRRGMKHSYDLTIGFEP